MTEKIEITYTSKEGRIGFQVNNVYYEYQLDTSYFPAVLKMSRSQPSKALNFVKRISPGMTKSSWPRDEFESLLDYLFKQ